MRKSIHWILCIAHMVQLILPNKENYLYIEEPRNQKHCRLLQKKNVSCVVSPKLLIYLQCKIFFAGLTRASLLKGLEEILVVINVSECRLCRVTKILELILQIPSAYYKEVKTRMKMINTGQKMVILLYILLYYYTIKMFRKLLCIF